MAGMHMPIIHYTKAVLLYVKIILNMKGPKSEVIDNFTDLWLALLRCN